MLPRETEKIAGETLPEIKKFVHGTDRSDQNAFPFGERIFFSVSLSHALGSAAVVLRIGADGKEPVDLPLSFTGSSCGIDQYTVTLDPADFCEPSGGLLYYEFLFLRGEQTLFTDTVNNLDFTLRQNSSNRFRLLIYRKGMQTPAWLASGTMYHLFVDRFFRAPAANKLHPGATLDPDWDHGIPQYAERPGDELSNTVFFGGNLQGVCEKLDYLQSLGVTVLYLSPIFEAESNHRYDTGDYETVDSLLGGDAAFAGLVAEAHKKGMKIILDGVFNHTGNNSKYFNAKGQYPTVGAAQSPNSPYADWYRFRSWPDDYESWWGIPILPRLNHENETCRRYFTGHDGIAARWIRAGADGWRLDVADELSDAFLDEFHDTVKGIRPDAAIIGEVWENAAEKISYGKRRRYLQGGELDSVMNYPFRSAVLDLLRSRRTEGFVHTLKEIWASYPRPICDVLMNVLGTHDTARILSVLGEEDDAWELLSGSELAKRKLTAKKKEAAVRLLKIAAILQFTTYGIPSVYYGDEAGLEGYRDPFCRKPFPWGRENKDLLAFYSALGDLRAKNEALHGGDFRFLHITDEAFVYERKRDQNRVYTAVNLGKQTVEFDLPTETTDFFTGERYDRTVKIPPLCAVIATSFLRAVPASNSRCLCRE